VIPPDTTKSFKRKGGDAPYTYSFSGLFREDTSQEQVFCTATLPMVEQVLAGKNALLFTYGVTNSGKTFTVQGTKEKPGLLPRAMDVLFNSIDGQQLDQPLFRPYCFEDVRQITADDRVALADLKADTAAAQKLTDGSDESAADAGGLSADADGDELDELVRATSLCTATEIFLVPPHYHQPKPPPLPPLPSPS
jgi:hypothetical protein